MTHDDIAKAKAAGQAKRLERKRRRVCFHVLSVTLAIKNINVLTSFSQPVSSAHLDWYVGLFSWNDWFFNGSKTHLELNPEKCLYRTSSAEAA